MRNGYTLYLYYTYHGVHLSGLFYSHDQYLHADLHFLYTFSCPVIYLNFLSSHLLEIAKKKPQTQMNHCYFHTWVKRCN